MKANKKIIGLVIAGGLLTITGFAVGNRQYEDYLASKENTKTEQITTENEYQNIETDEQSTEEKQKEILTNATDEELALATEKTLEKDFDQTKYKIDVDDLDDALIINVIIRDSDFTGISEKALNEMIISYGLDSKMNKLANMIHETYEISGRDKKILVAVSDDNRNVLYATTND